MPGQRSPLRHLLGEEPVEQSVVNTEFIAMKFLVAHEL